MHFFYITHEQNYVSGGAEKACMSRMRFPGVVLVSGVAGSFPRSKKRLFRLMLFDEVAAGANLFAVGEAVIGLHSRRTGGDARGAVEEPAIGGGGTFEGILLGLVDDKPVGPGNERAGDR
jgi:hypothetical protein